MRRPDIRPTPLHHPGTAAGLWCAAQLWPPPGYGPPLGYPAAPPGCGPPPGYGPPLGYGPPVAPGAVKPGIIPLRPLTLSDIFNGAVGYIRANPKATLGLTAMVVVTLQIISLVALFGPMTAFGDIVTRGARRADRRGGGRLVSVIRRQSPGQLAGGCAAQRHAHRHRRAGRVRFADHRRRGVGQGSRSPARVVRPGTAGSSRRGGGARAGGRHTFRVAAAANEAAAALLGFPLLLVVGVSLAYLYVVLLFAPVLIVLERLPIVEAITRSFALVRHGFWRVLGIRLLTVLVVGVVGNAIAAPFMIVGEIVTAVTASDGSVTMRLVGATLSAIG